MIFHSTPTCVTLPPKVFVHCAQCRVHGAQCTVHCALCTVHCVQCTVVEALRVEVLQLSRPSPVAPRVPWGALLTTIENVGT